jgi:diguanylate cyclase (GGDEF)-like protein
MRSDDEYMDSLEPERLRAIIETQTEIAASALDLDSVMALVVRRARELTSAAAGVIELAEGEEMVYHVASGIAEDHVGVRLKAAGSLSGLCVARGELLYCEDAESDHRVDLAACERVRARSLVCVPLGHRGELVGVLKVYDPRPCAFDSADISVLSLLSSVIAAHMAHASDYRDQQHLSLHDSLTGLPNRRCFIERLAAEGARLRRHGGEVSLCLMDLDGFKQINDALGHVAGDEVLRAVGAHLHELRGEDAAYRIGGDEFALILVAANEEGAALATLRIVEAVRRDPACRGVGVSFGVARLGEDDPAAALARADAAMYESKRASSR